MKLFILIGVLVILSGCSWLRYTWEPVLTQLPPNAIIIRIYNSHVLYRIDDQKYKAYYTMEGTIYQTIPVTK